MKPWVPVAMTTVATAFAGVGLALALAAVLSGEWHLLFGLIFVVEGLVLFAFVPAARRATKKALRGPPTTAVRSVPFSEVADLIREKLSGTPYAVELEGNRIRVSANLADSEFLGLASAHKVKVVRGVEIVTTKPGVTITRDFEQDLDLSLGVGQLAGSARVLSGRSWSTTRRLEYGWGKDGTFGRQVDVRFSSSEIRAPVQEVLKETGWYPGFWASQPPEGKFALIMAGMGASGVVIVSVALVIGALLGEFD